MKKEIFSWDELEIINEYMEGCNAFVGYNKRTGKYFIETYEETYCYDTKSQMMEDIKYTIGEWEKEN